MEHLWKVNIIAANEGYRTKKWKYFRYVSDPKDEELYDLETDPMEINNLAGNPQFEMILKEIRRDFERKANRLEKTR